MNTGDRVPKFVDYLPVAAFFIYWLYAGLICAVLTHEARMVKLGFVTLPLLAAMALAVRKIYKSHRDNP